MDYDLANRMNRVEGKIEYSLNVAMPFGEMPPGMLESKFEETDIGPDENAYDDYARNIVCDWTADTNRMEHEEPRNSIGNSGYLQLRYNGHRGDTSIDEVYRPEHFDQFIGDEDRDPRGSQVDPDMKQMTRQSMARTRFVRFTPDGCENITGGGRSEARTMADQQTLIRTVRSRLKVFERSLDGRQNGLRRVYGHKSAANQTILVQSYGDAITDKGLNPTRRANIIAQSVVNTRKFRDEMCDQTMDVAKYSQVRRGVKAVGQQDNSLIDNDGRFGASEGAKHFKACGLLMADIIRARQNIQSDVDFATSRDAMGRKTAPMCKDLGIILGAVATDAEFQSSSSTLVGKTAARLNRPHLANTTVQQHLTPAHHALNAEIIYKSVKPGADVRKLCDQIITDVVRTDADVSAAGKTAKMVMASGAKLSRTTDGEAATEFKKTINYRSSHTTTGCVSRLVNNDGKAGESSNTQNRKRDHTNYRTATPENQEQNMRYSENEHAERHGRGIGKKYLNRYIDRESNEHDHVSDA